jgi:hypothetical protein
MKPFAGRRLLIATMHCKEHVVAPILESQLEVRCVIPDSRFNSDRFGTFTRDIKRPGDQLETARRKAQKAAELMDIDLVVSTEGSFGMHPSIPFVPSNLELVLLLDLQHGYEIKGHYRTSETNMSHQWVSSVKEALEWAAKIGFPDHGVIVRMGERFPFGIYKDITTEADLIHIISRLLKFPFRRKVFLETDMRAHRNPKRMKAIEQATTNLISRLQVPCPQCSAPGFGVEDVVSGRPCSWCGAPTDLPMQEIHRCHACGFEKTKPIVSSPQTADPKYCEFCNP